MTNFGVLAPLEAMNDMRSLTTRSRFAQQGAASLLVALMLLLGGTIIAFFANRGFIFEQRTSANQYRATKAFELAEAGAEWALGKLNESVPLVAGASCTAGGAAATFRQRYATPTAGAGASPGRLAVNGTLMPRCRVNQLGVAACDCQETTGTSANLGSADNDQGFFGVRFVQVPGDDTAVEIISRGCTHGDALCDPSATSSSAEATAVVRVIAKVVPAVPAGPGAALTARSVTVSGGNLNVVNSHQPSNGITINAGGAVPTGSTVAVYSVPGTPSRASIIDNDASLANVTAAAEDLFFARFFGQTMSSYGAADPDVIRISGCAAAACGAQVMNYINQGLRGPRFFVDGDVTFDSAIVGGSTLGAADNPVVIATNGTLAISGNFTTNGVFYAAAIDATGAGTTTVNGALISRGAFDKSSGTLNVFYDPSLWSGTLKPTGRLARVPGSWRDKAAEY
jgi:Tfp pilus assembly protein PilX